MSGGPGDLVTHQAYFWDAAGEGQLLIKKCLACGEHYFVPRPFCAFCSSTDTQWVNASGRGEIYSFTLMRRKGEIVSAPALVTLEEGPILQTALIGGSPASYCVGLAVKLRFASSDHHPMTPFFEPAEAETSERVEESGRG
jgi:uncharacterized OB-fold protein